MLNSKTKLYAVIGNPVEHSLSPHIHNEAFKKIGFNACYVAFTVTPGGVASAIAGMRGLKIGGLSVTIPHKVTVMKYLDEIDPIAKKIGSVNTIVNTNGKLKGYNSDGLAALKCLKVNPKCRLNNARILVLGSGGAARSICFTLLTSTKIKSLTILGVIEKELKGLVRSLKRYSKVKIKGEMLTPCGLEKNIIDANILIHCTPMGMYPKINKSLVPRNLIDKNMVVFDIVYTPLETKLLKDAKARGAVTISGIDMFVYQAAVQFELWTKKKAPLDIMKKIVIRELKKRER